jgi:Ca2+-binding EF-hand superfamily protein
LYANISRDFTFFFIRKDVQAIFDKYAQNNVKRLNRQHALEMLQNEFCMTQQEAMVMFDTFDKDKNEIMSIWEFQQFYETVGAE